MAGSYELNEEAKALLAEANKSRPDYGSVTVAEMRARSEGFAWLARPHRAPFALDFRLPLADALMDARCYFPQGADGGGVVLYFHGGGWAMNDLAAFDALCASLATQSCARILSFAYPLAPETAYPKLLQQCEMAIEAVFSEPLRWSIDPKRIAIAGDSAGGNLAAVLAAKLHRESPGLLAGQLLIYPVLDRATDEQSFLDLGSDYLLDSEAMEWCWRQYVGDRDLAHDESISPLRASSFEGLPPTLIVSASHCPLSAQATRYVSALQVAGVDADQLTFGSIHGFAQFAGKWAVADAAIEAAGSFIQKCFDIRGER